MPAAEAAWLEGHAVYAPRARQELLAWLDRRLAALARAAGSSTTPVLERVCARTVNAWRREVGRLAERVARDRGETVEELVILGSPRALPPSAVGLTFASGERVIYKPRDLRAAAWFIDLCRAFNRLGPRASLHLRRVEPRDGYGWDEWVEAAPCHDPDLWFHRAGALLRLLTLVRGVDMHRHNLISAGDHPVLVDLDGLFRPRRRERTWLQRSPYATGLLPVWVVGAPGRMAHNGGGLASAPASPWQHRERILEGHDEAAALLEGADLGQLLERAAPLPVRFFPRPVLAHRQLLARSLEPERLVSEEARDAWLADRLDGPFAAAELAALRDGFLPVFHALPGGDFAILPDGSTLPGSFPGRALDDLWRSDRARDRDVIVTALAAGETAQPPPVIAAPRALDWKAAALELADQAVEGGLEVGVAWVPWAGVRRLGRLPTDVLSGSAGLALALARVFAAGGERRHRDAALRQLARTARAVEGRPMWYGAFLGLGGQLHSLQVCGRLLDEPAPVALAARRIAALRDERGLGDAGDDLVGGLAGLATACPEAWLGDRLLERRSAGLRPPPYPGAMPDGLPALDEGVAWALDHIAARTGDDAYRVPEIAPAPPRTPLVSLERALDGGRFDEAERVASEIAGRRAVTGSWLPESGLADRLHPSAVTGLLALAVAFLRLAAKDSA